MSSTRTVLNPLARQSSRYTEASGFCNPTTQRPRGITVDKKWNVVLVDQMTQVGSDFQGKLYRRASDGSAEKHAAHDRVGRAGIRHAHRHMSAQRPAPVLTADKRTRRPTCPTARWSPRRALDRFPHAAAVPIDDIQRQLMGRAVVMFTSRVNGCHTTSPQNDWPPPPAAARAHPPSGRPIGASAPLIATDAYAGGLLASFTIT